MGAVHVQKQRPPASHRMQHSTGICESLYCGTAPVVRESPRITCFPVKSPGTVLLVSSNLVLQSRASAERSRGATKPELFSCTNSNRKRRLWLTFHLTGVLIRFLNRRNPELSGGGVRTSSTPVAHGDNKRRTFNPKHSALHKHRQFRG